MSNPNMSLACSPELLIRKQHVLEFPYIEIVRVFLFPTFTTYRVITQMFEHGTPLAYKYSNSCKATRLTPVQPQWVTEQFLGSVLTHEAIPDSPLYLEKTATYIVAQCFEKIDSDIFNYKNRVGKSHQPEPGMHAIRDNINATRHTTKAICNEPTATVAGLEYLAICNGITHPTGPQKPILDRRLGIYLSLGDQRSVSV